MIKYTVKEVDISDISAGDTVEHNGQLLTVCRKDIRRCPFMGLSLFGDSYRSGLKKVKLAIIHHAKPNLEI